MVREMIKNWLKMQLEDFKHKRGELSSDAAAWSEANSGVDCSYIVVGLGGSSTLYCIGEIVHTDMSSVTRLYGIST